MHTRNSSCPFPPSRDDLRPLKFFNQVLEREIERKDERRVVNWFEELKELTGGTTRDEGIVSNPKR